MTDSAVSPSMDIHLTPRTRALILRYEHERVIADSTARDTLIRNGTEGDREVASAVLHPFDPTQSIREQSAESWSAAFEENERFADALLKKEAELGLDLPVHLFGCAPLTLMLHLGWCLPRRPLSVYQQASDTGAWSLAYERAQPAAAEDFFQVEGLPAAKQGGRGHVALIIEVTRSIRDKAIAEFQARFPSELLTTVCLRPVRGPSPTSVQHPSEVTRAVEQLRGVLDTLHQRLEGAESVLLAMSCPASFAAALGTAIKPNTQHPLWLHHFDDEKGYLPVRRIPNQRRARAAQASRSTIEQYQEASSILEQVQTVHRELLAWLAQSAQKPLIEKLGGENLLGSRIRTTLVTEPEPVFRYLSGEWTFSVDLLLGLKALRQRLGSKEDWEECLRLLLVHEAFHVQQGGPTSYNYRGSGRTGWVLEAVDYDADVVSFHAALDWRLTHRAGAEGPVRTRELAAIVWNALESMRVFEPERPVRELSERRLRRYLIWLFHACRLVALTRRKGAADQLERVTIEIAGLPSFPDPYESYSQQRIRLEGLGKDDSLAVAIYYQQQLAREMDSAWVRNLLQALSRWDEQPREEAQRAMTDLFHQLFDRHRFLVQPPPLPSKSMQGPTE